MRFRVMTYNIHKCIGGLDRLYRPQRIVDAIAHCRPDIVCLQEVDDGVPRSSHDRQVHLLGDALELPHRAFQRNVSLTRGHYGNAILSRFPLSDVHHLELTVPPKKRRRGLAVHCRIRCEEQTRTLLLFNVHLGLAGFERSIQLRRILSSELLDRTQRKTAVIVAGDFNDVWGNLGRNLLEPAEFKPAGTHIRTFPAALPLRPLDRIYYRGDIQLEHVFGSHTDNVRQASDHLPLVAEFVFPTLGE